MIRKHIEQLTIVAKTITSPGWRNKAETEALVYNSYVQYMNDLGSQLTGYTQGEFGKVQSSILAVEDEFKTIQSIDLTLHQKISIINYNLYLARAEMENKGKEAIERAKTLQHSVFCYMEADNQLNLLIPLLDVDKQFTEPHHAEKALSTVVTTENTFLVRVNKPQGIGAVVHMVMEDKTMTEVYVNLYNDHENKAIVGKRLLAFLKEVNIAVQDTLEGNDKPISFTYAGGKTIVLQASEIAAFYNFVKAQELEDETIYQLYDAYVRLPSSVVSEEHHELAAIRDSLTVEIRSAQEELNTLNAQKEALERQFSGLREAIAEAKSEAEANIAVIDELERETARAKEAYEAQLRQYDADVAILDDTYAEELTALEAKQTRLQQSVNRLAPVEAGLKARIAKYTEHIETNEDLYKANHQLQRQVEELETKLARVEAEHAAVLARMDEEREDADMALSTAHRDVCLSAEKLRDARRASRLDGAKSPTQRNLKSMFDQVATRDQPAEGASSPEVPAEQLTF